MPYCVFSSSESVGDDNFLVYPDKTSDNLDKQYFVNEINFDDAPSGSFFIGAKLVLLMNHYSLGSLCVHVLVFFSPFFSSERNSLYEFNQATLKITKQYNWKAETANVQSCESNAKDPVSHTYQLTYKKY